MAPSIHDGMGGHSHSHLSHGSGIAAGHRAGASGRGERERSREDRERESDNESLFGVVPEDKKRKFILVQDEVRGSRVRVRVTLDTVDPKEIPDSYRKSNSVFPRSWFPMQMQSPPPSARGSRFFESDDDDGDARPGQPFSGASRDGPSARGKTMVNVPLPDGSEGVVATPRMRRTQRTKEVKLNELGYRMTWHQSRVFANRTVFLQKACEFSPPQT